MAGSSKDPVMMSVDPAKAGQAVGGVKKTFKVKTVASLEKRIAYLEKMLKDAKVTFEDEA